MIPILSTEQQRAIAHYGTPLPLIDAITKQPYILLPAELIPNYEQGGFTARVVPIAAYGEGETEEDACRALVEALRGYFDAFGDSLGSA